MIMLPGSGVVSPTTHYRMHMTYLGQAIKVRDTVFLCTLSGSLAFSPQNSVIANLPGQSNQGEGHCFAVHIVAALLPALGARRITTCV